MDILNHHLKVYALPWETVFLRPFMLFLNWTTHKKLIMGMEPFLWNSHIKDEISDLWWVYRNKLWCWQQSLNHTKGNRSEAFKTEIESMIIKCSLWPKNQQLSVCPSHENQTIESRQNDSGSWAEWHPCEWFHSYIRSFGPTNCSHCIVYWGLDGQGPAPLEVIWK